MIGNFTEQEYLDLKSLMSTVKDYIDPNQVHPIWNAYNKITGNTGGAPCTCNPRKWIDAVNDIRNFISQNG
jgi:hypothetical protein